MNCRFRRLNPFVLVAAFSFGTTCLAAGKDDVESDLSFHVSVLSNNAMPVNIVKEGARWNFGPGALQTFAGYQYAAYWDDARQVSVARRKLPLGAWETVSLPGYQRTSNINRGKGGKKSRGFGDGHEKVAMGISSDGVIHLAFDHHVSTLHYRRSIKGIANDPQNVDWKPDLFGDVQENLGGPKIETVTYPTFTTDGDQLLLYLRLNVGSGSADSHVFRYRSGKWIVNDPTASKMIDKRWSGGDKTVNAYPHGLFIRDGRYYMTWCWRDTPDASTCHDLCFITSDDQGRRWKNNVGAIIGVTGRKFITADSPGVSVVDIPPGTKYQNGGSMTVDFRGRVHVLMKGPKGTPVYFTREPDDASDSSEPTWQTRDSKVLGKLVSSPDGSLFAVSEDAVYVCDEFRQTAASDSLSPPAGMIEFKKVATIDPAIFEDCKPAIDRRRVEHDGCLSIMGQQGKKITVVDFYLGR